MSESAALTCDLVQTSALRRFRDLYPDLDVTAEPYQSTLPIHGQWLSLILIQGSGIRITFRSHYNRRPIAELAAPDLGISPEEVTEPLIKDFVREFCNLTAAQVKARLIKNGVDVVSSLPLTTRGIDELFFGGTASGLNSAISLFKIDWKKGHLICTVQVDLSQQVSSHLLPVLSPLEQKM